VRVEGDPVDDRGDQAGVGEDGALGDFDIESDGTSTVLTGDLDQAVLYGALNRIHLLGLEVCAGAY
jgi:hypothetical protein